jgi:hypothetical protein
MSPEEAAILFDQLTKTTRQGRDGEWLHLVVEVLSLPGCYVPAAQKILRQGAWRRHTGGSQNPIGYVKTATEREGLRMGLATHRHDRSEPRVPTKDQPQRRQLESRTEELRFDHVDKRRGHVDLAVPQGMTFSDYIDRLQGASSQGMLTKTRRGTWHQGSAERDDYPRRWIPDWLQRDGESDAVDWETVAKYAAQKVYMVPSLAKVLRLRLQQRIGRPAAMRAASSPREAREIEAAWKWIDRYACTRIAPLFRLSEPPVLRGDAKVRDGLQKDGFIRAAQALRSVLDAHLPPRPRRSW